MVLKLTPDILKFSFFVASQLVNTIHCETYGDSFIQVDVQILTIHSDDKLIKKHNLEKPKQFSAIIIF